MTRTLMIALALSATACKGGSPAAAEGGATPASAASSTAASAAPASAAPAIAATSTSGETTTSAKAAAGQADTGQHGGHQGGGEAKWDGPVQWKPWTEAQAQATAEKKRIMLLVYTNWCPRCRELVPVFTDPEVASLAEKLVMVRQDGDEKPDWLNRYAEFGGYFPRIFFLEADGTVITTITSGHPRYPYFFGSTQVGALKDAMRKAGEG
jgi:thiol-disulfide isomerase/thioredoxin